MLTEVANVHLGWESKVGNTVDLVFHANVLALLDDPELQAELQTAQSVIRTISLGTTAVPYSFSKESIEAMRHYLANTGTPRTIDLKQLLTDVPTARTAFETSFKAVIKHVDTLDFVGSMHFTESVAHYIPTEDVPKWHTAVGDYTGWGDAAANGKLLPDGTIEYSMTFCYNFWDPYDWDATHPSLLIRRLVSLHLAGLAKQYMVTAKMCVSTKWIQGSPPTYVWGIVTNSR